MSATLRSQSLPISLAGMVVLTVALSPAGGCSSSDSGYSGYPATDSGVDGATGGSGAMGGSGGTGGSPGEAGPAPLSCASTCAEAEACGETSAHRCECACAVHEEALSEAAWDAVYEPCYGLSCDERASCVAATASRLSALAPSTQQSSTCDQLCALWVACGFGTAAERPVCDRLLCNSTHLWSQSVLGELSACNQCDTLFDCVDQVYTSRGLDVAPDSDPWSVTEAACPACDPADPCSSFCALDCAACPDREGCCATEADCTVSPRTRCADGVCVQCTSSTQCAAPAIYCRDGRCVECTDNGYCPPSKPMCVNNKCEPL